MWAVGKKFLTRGAKIGVILIQYFDILRLALFQQTSILFLLHFWCKSYLFFSIIISPLLAGTFIVLPFTFFLTTKPEKLEITDDQMNTIKYTQSSHLETTPLWGLPSSLNCFITCSFTLSNILCAFFLFNKFTSAASFNDGLVFALYNMWVVDLLNLLLVFHIALNLSQ